MTSRDAMTTNDTKALVAELREIRATMSDNTNLLRLLVKQVEKAGAWEFKWPPEEEA